MTYFSIKLISKYKEYMLKKHNVEISDSQAQLDLKSLSNLYVAFFNSKQ
jgi:hypothetical protein